MTSLTPGRVALPDLSDAVVMTIHPEDCPVDWMRQSLPEDAIAVGAALPAMRTEVIGWLSDPSVCIYFTPAVVWRTPNHPGNPDDWWSGVPGRYTRLHQHGWKLSHWSPLPAGRAALAAAKAGS